MARAPAERLKKQLTLFDVFVVSTGAMFSSGFFLLPGIAAGQTGPAVVMAYVVSAVLIVPAMLSSAELATAMPKAGGAYYFLDRTLGPLVGMVGGIGTWAALMLKSAFALIGMGAYLGLIFDVSIKPLAIGFTIVFGILNIVGTRESTRVVRFLVLGLLSITALFLIHGLANVAAEGVATVHRERFTPFLTDGLDGFLSTVGLVFVSYVGLTKVASLAEEVTDPERNIPLGMALSLGTVTTIYGFGVYVMVAVLGTDTLRTSLTPVADTAAAFITWIPSHLGMWLVVAAAIAAFTSMANTGILAASRYPLAMARDHLLPMRLAALGRFRTPVAATVITCGLMIGFIAILDVPQVAKLASALQLLLFGLLNVAVIVMRESGIESYDPGFRSPLYPWTQLAGVTFSLILVAEMGWLASLFSIGVVAVSMGWYNYYARGRLVRDGAIYHVFERLGRRRFAGLDRELRDIMKEKGVRDGDSFDEVVTRAGVIDGHDPVTLRDAIDRAADLLATRLAVTSAELTDRFVRGVRGGATPIARGVALLHARVPTVEQSEIVLARYSSGVSFDPEDEIVQDPGDQPVRAIFFLVSGTSDPGRHLRILAQLAGRVEDDEFVGRWLEDADEQELKETLLRDDRFLSLELRSGRQSELLIGKALRDLRMPEGSLIALIRRYGETVVPRGRTVLREGDRLTIIGEPAGLREIHQQYGGGEAPLRR